MRRGHAGVSLVELMVLLTVAGVLLAAAAPAYHRLLRHQSLLAAVNDLVAAIDLTRSQAITRGAPVLLAPLEPGGTVWREGWTVFIDANGNRRPDPGEARIAEHGALAEGIDIAAAFSSGAAPAYLSYNGAGRSCSASNSLAGRWGTLTLTQDGEVRNIKINMLGRLRVCDPVRDGAACDGAND